MIVRKKLYQIQRCQVASRKSRAIDRSILRKYVLFFKKETVENKKENRKYDKYREMHRR